MTHYNADEIFQFAIRIEENGALFYLKLAEKYAHDGELKAFFRDLASQEKDHGKLFHRMVREFKSYQPPEAFPAEYFAYLRAFADNAIFSEEKLANQVAAIQSPEAALDFCMQRESAAVTYYTELKPLVPEAERDQIDKLIAEEKGHYLQLDEIKKKRFVTAK